MWKSFKGIQLTISFAYLLMYLFDLNKTTYALLQEKEILKIDTSKNCADSPI